MKQTVVFDFDGVIHSYTSGWKGETVIPDPPVSGIKEAIAEIRGAGYEVAVVSTRCASLDGLFAVEDYLRRHNIEVDAVQAEKPPAVVYIDDRALCFNGDAAGLLGQIRRFAPWYKRPKPGERIHGKVKPKTNGDWIRDMSDECLADFIGQERLCDRIQAEGSWCDEHPICRDCLVEWLRKPFEEGEEE